MGESSKFSDIELFTVSLDTVDLSQRVSHCVSARYRAHGSAQCGYRESPNMNLATVSLDAMDLSRCESCYCGSALNQPRRSTDVDLADMDLAAIGL